MKMFEVYPLLDSEPVKGKGCYLYDNLDNDYLDFYGGHAVISIGHTHPVFVERVQDQLKRLGFYSNSVPIKLQHQLADKLGKLSSYESFKLFLCNSGAEANENAFKIASAHTKRGKILTMRGAFHGRTSLAVAASDNTDIQYAVNKTDVISRIGLEDFDSAADLLRSKDFCCVIVEGIQGVNGVITPSNEFLQHLRMLCDETGTLLILDEIQAGYGRTGSFFAHQKAGVIPDLITVAKGMGNGFPVAGVLIHPHIKASKGMLGSTFGGNHLACAAALAVLEVIENEQLIQNAAQMGAYLAAELQKLEHIAEVRGRGLMIGIKFPSDATDIRKKLLSEYRIFTGGASDKRVLRLLPPLSIKKHECDIFIKALEGAFQ